MDVLRTIGELASAVGIPTSTIRYYERAGLLQPGGRSQGNYRLYGEEALERMRFIRAAQATGFTLADVTKLLAHRQNSADACGEVEDLVKERLADIKEQMVHLEHVQTVLKATLARCRRTEKPKPCPALHRLETAIKQPLQTSKKPGRRKTS